MSVLCIASLELTWANKQHSLDTDGDHIVTAAEDHMRKPSRHDWGNSDADSIEWKLQSNLIDLMADSMG